MSTRKRNEWLDADDSSEDEDAGYNSGAEEQSKGRALAGRASKRRRVDDESDAESADDDDDDADKAFTRGGTHDSFAVAEAVSPLRDSQHDPNDAPERTAASKKPLTKERLEKAQKAAKKTGVIYLSRVPPFMKPATVKSLLSPHGTIGRIFLTPEDPTAYKRRKAAGGNKKKSYVDGWVEFLDKKDAKAAVELLNAGSIGGKKGGYYHDDVWNLRYLKGFKWHHLTEQIANENAERAGRMRAEIARSTRENKAFLANVERAKMLEGMEAKKKKKAAAAEEEQTGSSGRDVRRQFRQSEVRSKKAKDSAVEQPEEVKRVLSKIF